METDAIASPVLPSFLPAEVLSAREQARHVLEIAHREAARRLSLADERLEALAESVREEALEAARQEIERRILEGEARLAARRRRLERAAASAALSVARRVWRQEAADPTQAVLEVEQEMRAALGPVEVRFRVHPDDLDRLAGALVAEPDASLRPGDCVAEWGGGEWDARASVRAEMALATLADALGLEVER